MGHKDTCRHCKRQFYVLDDRQTRWYCSDPCLKLAREAGQTEQIPSRERQAAFKEAQAKAQMAALKKQTQPKKEPKK